MLRRLTALLLTLLLPLGLARAETAQTDASAIIGVWHTLYRIENGLADSADSADTYVFTAQGVIFPGSTEERPLAPVDASFHAATAEGRITVFTLAGENLMTASTGSVTRILTRVTSQSQPVTPFLGDWQMILVSINGTASTSSASGDAFFDFRFSPYTVSTLVDGVVFSAQPCTYLDGQCIIPSGASQIVCTLSDSGLMTMHHQDTGLMCFLVPAGAENGR